MIDVSGALGTTLIWPLVVLIGLTLLRLLVVRVLSMNTVVNELAVTAHADTLLVCVLRALNTLLYGVLYFGALAFLGLTVVIVTAGVLCNIATLMG